MELTTPTFQIQIDGEPLESSITKEILALVFEDNEQELDVLSLTVANRDLRLTDAHFFQEGNEISVRFGYRDQLSPIRTTVIKDIDYDFPESGCPTIRVKAYDKAFKMAGSEIQKVWQKPAPGILYSEIAAAIAEKHGLEPVITPTLGFHLRVVQSNISDARFLQDLAAKARAKEGAGLAGFAFYVEGHQLHFHPQGLDLPPSHQLAYFPKSQGVLRAFRPATQSQAAKGAGTETKTIGIDPRKRKIVTHKANNQTAAKRTSLGHQTYLVDGNTGEGVFQDNQSGHIVPTFDRAETIYEEPVTEPAQDLAEGRFKAAEMRQVEATALTIGLPDLAAKQNVAISGVGEKFSGIYYCISVRHTIDASGYQCEAKLRRNALGKGAGSRSEPAKGIPNRQEDPKPPPSIFIDANTGNQRKSPS